MKTIKSGALMALVFLLSSCGEQLVEFPKAPTGTVIAPTVVSTDPASAATNVVLNKRVSASFSTAMTPSTLNATTFTLKAGSAAVAGAVTYVGVTATFTPSAALASNTLYTALISTGAKDLAGTPMAAPYTWTFTTGSTLDAVAPTVTSTDPADLATNVAVTKHPAATFSEPMDPTTITASTFTLKQGTTSIPGTVSYAAAGTTATFVPTSPLTVNTVYTATITAGVTDTAGNHMASDHVWSFTTSSSACGLAPVALGTAANFAVLAGSAVTNTGNTLVTGDLGLSPGLSVGGFKPPPTQPGTLVGTQYVGTDPIALQAKLDLTTAYNDAKGRSLCRITVAAPNLGGQTLAPGLYWSGTSLNVTSGTLTLDAGGDPNAVFIFQMAETLTTTSGLGIVLAGGAKASNIFWQVGSSATIGSGSVFYGTIMAQASVTMVTGATLDGRALAQTGAVSLAGNTVTLPPP
jgi:hypothetical protein